MEYSKIDQTKKYSSLSVNELRQICCNANINFNNKPMSLKGGYIKKKTLIELLISNNNNIKSGSIPIKQKKTPNLKELNTENCYSLAVKGERDYMEDTFTINTFEDMRVYAVFDGHGGDEISTKLVRIYPKALFQNLTRDVRYDIKKVKNIIIKLYFKIDELLKKENGESGSTAIVCLTIGNTIYMINLGDSRGILYYYKDNEPVILHATNDHKPNNMIEKLWINKCNGTVEEEEDDDPRVDGILALSRAFGDYGLKYSNIDNKVGPVSNIPDIKCYPNDFSKKLHIILASDGLWDVMTNNEALKYIDRQNIKNSCQLIVNDALKTSTDNITVLIASLN